MTDKKPRWSTGEKVYIIPQTLNPQASMAEICRGHSLAPRAVYGWKEKFPAGGQSSLDGPDALKQAKRHEREIAPPRRIIGECAVANDALKKSAGGRGLPRHCVTAPKPDTGVAPSHINLTSPSRTTTRSRPASRCGRRRCPVPPSTGRPPCRAPRRSRSGLPALRRPPL